MAGKGATTFKGWSQAGRSEFDVAVVRLVENIGDTVGWLGIQSSTGKLSATLHTAGYPGDKPYATMWYAKCSVTDSKATDGVLIHTCDTNHGQSGSAMWTYYNDSKKNCGARCIRAVHHGGADVGSDN